MEKRGGGAEGGGWRERVYNALMTKHGQAFTCLLVCVMLSQLFPLFSCPSPVCIHTSAHLRMCIFVCVCVCVCLTRCVSVRFHKCLFTRVCDRTSAVHE